ncbi:hypothetical protein A1O1_07009 [Capronia coronata CBS 617.96]|uniref:Aconitate hydratase n=1 Tax=Capronia coronata CBS 617.96 TaxID=1182541 RepID=W9XS79_9EURO|nr:uncharacterized protein A1O1_07009 [Capronia coronata CBS 617.96]EXJ83387.1 hypothetical protein A1O1_07009 [Capronia coronata CBS 617.96]
MRGLSFRYRVRFTRADVFVSLTLAQTGLCGEVEWPTSKQARRSSPRITAWGQCSTIGAMINHRVDDHPGENPSGVIGRDNSRATGYALLRPTTEGYVSHNFADRRSQTLNSAIPDGQFQLKLLGLLSRVRGIALDRVSVSGAKSSSYIPDILLSYAGALQNAQRPAEAEALEQARQKCVDEKVFGGLGLVDATVEATPAQEAEALFLVEAWLEAINAREKARDYLSYRRSPAPGTRPMNLAQKIFAQHALGEKPANSLGTADVMMALALGETWFKIPDSILIEMVGQPALGMSGKDVILHILGELKRNTVAAERIVEFSGDGLKYLSIDARFAISNMCTEFGAITGIFVPDRVTSDYIARRRRKANKPHSLYFRPDPDAEYAGRYTIDLSHVEPAIARYPSPDDVVPVSELAGTPLDGVFIGASKGKRHYVPGSLPIVEKLKRLHLLEIYEAAGFSRGPPGCSYCMGLSAEKASEGETWLSSQNRNFKNRMGKGAFGHVTSAIVCAASSFDMTITSPVDFLKDLDLAFFKQYRQLPDFNLAPIEYVEPDLSSGTDSSQTTNLQQKDLASVGAPSVSDSGKTTSNANSIPDKIASKIVTLGDFIDTDALAPGPTLTTCVTDEDFGAHVLEYTHPDFRARVRDQHHQIVVAGQAFGVGSSREVAVSALKGVGVKAVIARSFAFIYGRNQPSLGLLAVTVVEDEFFQAATDGEEIVLDIPRRSVSVGAGGRLGTWSFQLSEMEFNLTVNHGLTESYNKFGKSIWGKFTGSGSGKNEDKSVAKALEEGVATERTSQERKVQW